MGISGTPPIRVNQPPFLRVDAVALGWPDESFPANAVVSERKSVQEAARFLGFDD